MSLLVNHKLIGTATIPITYFGSSNQGSGNSATLTPPSSMLAGDFVYVKFCVGSSGRTGSISNGGGQSWTLTQDNTFGSLGESWTATCVFNGTWSANPVFAISGTLVAKVYIMFVFRGSPTWTVDVPMAATNLGSGLTQTVIGQTATQARVLTIASWQTSNEAASGTSSANSWLLLGNETYGNSGPNNRALSFAYRIGGVGATGNVSKTYANSVSCKTTIVTYYNS